MNGEEQDIDLGPSGKAVFTHLEDDELGEPVAFFVTDDAQSFVLGAEALVQRIAALAANGKDASEERRALRRLAAG